MASLAQRQAPQPAVGSQTQTEQQTRPRAPNQPQAILRLRGAHNPSDRSVKWRDDVVDNEGLGRKKSKVCCIYHPPRAVDESSDESSSDSSSSNSDSDVEGGSHRDGGRNGSSGPKKGKGKARPCDDPSHGHSHGGDRMKTGEDRDESRRLPSPNAYERLPKQKPKDQNSGVGNVEDSTGPGKAS